MAVVLVVDDDEFTCDAIRRLLTRMGYTTACASSGAQALDLLGQVRPDVIVLDWMMPEMDGLEVLRKLRADPRTKDVPVLLYSAADDPAMQKQAARLGAMECVLKSGGFYPLYERIERYATTHP
jgi:CheY-like chemotaxis protein